ncbi:location of vulva defective 1 [Bicyclus anynana]|uniref:Location of vulva defective 1 n=1 Tax=Bicyclus anynana TaxID=110368 RepID=A0A6J1MFG2_BICAN|nr:location of vulva defective 1 [Bicyclus anynana]
MSARRTVIEDNSAPARRKRRVETITHPEDEGPTSQEVAAEVLVQQPIVDNFMSSVSSSKDEEELGITIQVAEDVMAQQSLSDYYISPLSTEDEEDLASSSIKPDGVIELPIYEEREIHPEHAEVSLEPIIVLPSNNSSSEDSEGVLVVETCSDDSTHYSHRFDQQESNKVKQVTYAMCDSIYYDPTSNVVMMNEEVAEEVTLTQYNAVTQFEESAPPDSTQVECDDEEKVVHDEDSQLKTEENDEASGTAKLSTTDDTNECPTESTSATNDRFRNFESNLRVTAQQRSNRAAKAKARKQKRKSNNYATIAEIIVMHQQRTRRGQETSVTTPQLSTMASASVIATNPYGEPNTTSRQLSTATVTSTITLNPYREPNTTSLRFPTMATTSTITTNPYREPNTTSPQFPTLTITRNPYGEPNTTSPQFPTMATASAINNRPMIAEAEPSIDVSSPLDILSDVCCMLLHKDDSCPADAEDSDDSEDNNESARRRVKPAKRQRLMSVFSTHQ